MQTGGSSITSEEAVDIEALGLLIRTFVSLFAKVIFGSFKNISEYDAS